MIPQTVLQAFEKSGGGVQSLPTSVQGDMIASDNVCNDIEATFKVRTITEYGS